MDTRTRHEVIIEDKQSIHKDFKCVCAWLCLTEVGGSGGGTTVVMRDLHSYTLYCMCVLTSGHTRGAAAEDDILEEQHLKWTQFGLTM